MNLIPAYGRDYKSIAAVRAAWLNGDDFQIADISSRFNGKYVSSADVIPASEFPLTVRYAKLTKVTTIPFKGKK